MLNQVPKATLKVLGFCTAGKNPGIVCGFNFNIYCSSPFSNRYVEEVDEPHEGVLVHWVDVGQICSGEEQHRAVFSDWPIASSRLLYLFLCLVSNFLLFADFV